MQAGLHVRVSLPRCGWTDHNLLPHCGLNKSVLALSRLYQELSSPLEMLPQGVNVPFSLPLAFSWYSCATNRTVVRQELGQRAGKVVKGSLSSHPLSLSTSLFRIADMSLSAPVTFLCFLLSRGWEKMEVPQKNVYGLALVHQVI